MNIEGKEFLGPFLLDDENLPEGKAVYIIYGDGEAPIYIGVANNLRARLRQHLASDTFKRAAQAPILHYWPFEKSQLLEARKLEASLIYSQRPQFNKNRPAIEAETLYGSMRRVESARKFSIIVAGVASSVGVALTVAMFIGLLQDKSKNDGNDTIEARFKKIESSQAEQAKVISGLAINIKSLQTSIESTSNKANALATNRDLARISEELKAVATKVSALESALNSDPAKSLAVPLLRKDLDNTRENFKANLDQTKSEIDRIYDQNKWFIGLMFTIALSVLGMAASNLLARREPLQATQE